MDVTLRWAGAADADATTDYRIESDEAASGVYVAVATQDAAAPYAPVTTTLALSLSETATTVELADGTDFAADSYINVGREMIKLGVKDTDTYSDCTRGVAGTLPAAHSLGAAVTAAHESYTDSPDFGSRHVIRYKVIRTQGLQESIAALAVAVYPGAPPDTAHCTVYGILVDSQGDIKSGVPVQLSVAAAGNYSIGAGFLHHRETESATTDNDGYFEFYLPKDADEEGDAGYTITVAPDTTATLAWPIPSVPDVDHINFLEL